MPHSCLRPLALVAAAIVLLLAPPSFAQDAVRPAVAPPFAEPYVMPDSDLFLHVRVADLMEGPFVKPFLTGRAAEIVSALEAALKVELTEIESVTISGPVLKAAQEELDRREREGTDPTRSEEYLRNELALLLLKKSLYTVRMKQDYDPSQIRLAENTRLVDAPIRLQPDANGRLQPLAVGDAPAPGGLKPLAGLFYLSNEDSPFPDVSIWMPDRRTVVAGLGESIGYMAGTSLTKLKTTRTGFAGAKNGTIVVALAPEDGLNSLPDLPGAATQSAKSAAEYDRMRQTLAGLTLTVDLMPKSPTLSLVTPALRPSDSAEMAELDGIMGEAPEQVRKLAGAVDALPPPFALYAKQFLQSAEMTTDDGIYAMTLTFPAEVRAIFEGMGG
ncbi:MAG: hypothetical protein AAF907_06735 [Planctomycetota bacterium]